MRISITYLSGIFKELRVYADFLMVIQAFYETNYGTGTVGEYGREL